MRSAKSPPDFFEARPVKVVGILRDFDNETNDRRINTYNRSGQGEHARWISHLLRQHVPVDMVWPEEKFDGYGILVAPHLKMVDAGLVEKLNQFVQAGGVLVLGAQSGSKDRNCHIVEIPMPGLLRELAGIEIDDWTTLSEKETCDARFDDGQIVAMGTFVEKIVPLTAKSIAHWSTDPLLIDAPAITCNSVGKGWVVYVGGYCTLEAIAVIWNWLASRFNIQSIADASGEVEVILRSNGSKIFRAILNHSPIAQKITGITTGLELISGNRVAEEIGLSGFEIAIILEN